MRRLSVVKYNISVFQFFSAAHRHKIMSLPWSINRLSGEIMEDTGEKRRKYGKYSDFLEDVWYNLWKIIKSYPLEIKMDRIIKNSFLQK